MTIHNLGSKTTVLGLLRNDVVTATGTGSAIDLQGYEVEYSGYGISVPRTGTPISNVLDVVFPSDGGTKWIYFQILLLGE